MIPGLALFSLHTVNDLNRRIKDKNEVHTKDYYQTISKQ